MAQYTVISEDKDLVCDWCCRDIEAGDTYIEDKYGNVYCDEDELLESLEESEYFVRKQAE